MSKGFSKVACLGLAVSVLWGLSAKAQQRHAYSAKEAAEYAIKHVTEIKNLRIDRELRDASNKEVTAQAYPQVSGSVGMQHFFDIPVTLLPDFITPQVYGVLEKQGVKDGSGNPIKTPAANPQFFPAQFGVPWQSSVGLTFQQLLFQPDVFVGLQARAGALRLADQNIKVMEDSVRGNVMRAYYGVLIAEKRREFLLESLSRLRKLQSDQEKLFQNGFIERLDLEKTQVALNNLQTTVSQLDNFLQIGNASLKFAMGLPQKDTLVLTEKLTVEGLKESLLEGADFRYEDRNEVKLVNTAVELQQLDLKRYKLAYAPTVAAFWNVSRNALRQDFNFFNRDLPWFKSSVAGVSINVPVFDGMQKQQRIRQARLRLERTQNDREFLQRAIDLQQVATLSGLKNALSSLDLQERNMKLAEKVYQTTKKKYEQGLGSSFEILQADQEFQTAQSNYFQALYDAMNARIGYRRSLGRL